MGGSIPPSINLPKSPRFWGWNSNWSSGHGMRRANVYCRGILAGTLEKDRERYRFRYVPEYLESPKYPAISSSFPKEDRAFESAHLFPFFFGLLAEGDDKSLQCRLFKID